VWAEDTFSYEGDFYRAQGTILEPKPVQDGGIPLYAGGGSEEGRTMIAHHCDHYLMHSGTPEKIAGDIDDMRQRRADAGFDPDDMQFGMAAYVICRDTEEEAQAELDRITTIDPAAEGYNSYEVFINNSELDSDSTSRTTPSPTAACARISSARRITS
jgi:FMNH2-dependent dimethyl sulfone monooxygenase